MRVGLLQLGGSLYISLVNPKSSWGLGVACFGANLGPLGEVLPLCRTWGASHAFRQLAVLLFIKSSRA